MGWKCVQVAYVFAGFFALSAMGQQNRITRPIDNLNRVILAGHLHPKATPANDRGRVSPSLELSYVTLTLAQSDAQKADLEQLLAQQQDPGSSNYHHWLTPEEFAGRFGASEADLNQVTTWLQTQGLKVASVARGRSWIAVNGSAAQVEAAFQTELHQYSVDGETHFANAAEPSVPAAFNGVIRNIRGLNDFRMKPARRLNQLSATNPQYTSSHGNHYLAPDDLATIYNIKPLYQAGFDGTGQKIVVAGQTQITLSDINTFRSSYNLSTNPPQTLLIPGSRNPGLSSSDLPEADLDVEWSGAVARNASILYVYAYDVMSAVQYAIDQNLAPVVSVSYGACEAETAPSDASAFRSWAQQGNAQGITWFAASGDAGAADCDDAQNSGATVDLPAALPEVTGVGGTEFVEGSGVFWNSSNDANGASALSYIPEMAWNDSVSDGEPAATGGGASTLYAKPSWQVGPGVPNDNARHVPDISLNASADHDGYLVYTGGSLAVYGGTSVPTPCFAGIAALLNQSLVSSGAQSKAGLGNINPKLYALAQQTSGVFHDVTAGDNIVTVACTKRQRNCVATAVGFSSGVGYDQTTGLGSVDTYKLATAWNGGSTITPITTASIGLVSNLSALGTTDVTYLTATVVSPDGVTPTGSISFTVDGTQLGASTLTGSAGTATATLPVQGNQLPQGSDTITATYGTSATASVTVSVSTSSSATGTPVISGLVNPANYQQTVAPGGILSVFGSQLAGTTQTIGTIPLPISSAGVSVLINGEAAPLYYISAGLLNVQIPYEIAPGSVATLSVNNNGKVATQTFTVAAAAPAIFTASNSVVVPTGSASRGQEIAVYITGAGAVTPAVSTGATVAPTTLLNALPHPSQNSSVTVGSATAVIDFIGIPSGLVGVTQINFTVPSGASLGSQPVIVSIGGIRSTAALLTVVN